MSWNLASNKNIARYQPKSLAKRLIFGVFALMIVVQVASILIVAVFLNQAHREETFSELESYADFVAQSLQSPQSRSKDFSDVMGGLTIENVGENVEQNPPASFSDFSAILPALNPAYRVTVIDLSGQVLFDSALKSASLDNHLHREEVQNLMQGKSPKALRFSDSQSKENLYFTRFIAFGEFIENYPPPSPLRKGGGIKEKSLPLREGFREGEIFADSEFKDNLAQETPLQNTPQNPARKLILRVSKDKDSLLAYLLHFAPLFSTLLAFSVVASIVLGVLLTRKILQPIKNIDLSHPIRTNPYAELHIFMQRISKQKKKIKKQLKRIKQNRAQLELIRNNINDGFLVLDSQGVITQSNAKALEMLRLPQGENVFRHNGEFSEAIKRSIDSRNEAFEIALNAYFCYVICMPIFVKSAKSTKAEKPENPAKPTLKAIIILLFDKSQQRDILALRREFSANVTHELKTPLSSILLSSEMLNSGLVAESDKEAFIAKIYAESKRLLTLIEKILKISFLEEGKSLEKERVNLESVVRQMLPSVEALAGKKGTKIECDLSMCESSEVLGIPALLEDMVYNLCENAIKYSGGHSKSRQNGVVRIALSCESGERGGENSVILSVADNGIGIALKEQERIFERFYCVDKSRSKNLGGNGLGLAIVKRIAKIHNAKIALKSELGKGSEFVITFPAFDRASAT